MNGCRQNENLKHYTNNPHNSNSKKKNYCEEKAKSIDKTFYFQTVALNIGE